MVLFKKKLIIVFYSIFYFVLLHIIIIVNYLSALHHPSNSNYTYQFIKIQERKRSQLYPKPKPTNTNMSVNTVNLEEHQPQTPLGLILAPIISRENPLHSNYTILIGWTRPYNKLGIVQKSGQIRIGDRLVEINNISIRTWTYEKIIRVLRCFDDGVRIKSLGFEVLKDDLAFNSGIGGLQSRTFNWSVARRRLYSLTTSIRSYRVDIESESESGLELELDAQYDHGDNGDNGDNNTVKNKKVARFEIRCELLIRHYQKNDKAVNFSIWKRFSEFKAMHDVLKKAFEWQLEGGNQGRGIYFPSDRPIQSVFYGATSDKFLKNRRRDLDHYWSSLQDCQAIFDFADPSSHRYSKDMAEFLSIAKYLHSPDVIMADSVTCEQKSTGGRNRERNQNHHNDHRRRGDDEGLGLGLDPLDMNMNTNMSMNISALSDIPPISASPSELKLDASGGEFGEIVVPSGGEAATSGTGVATPTRTRTHNNRRSKTGSSSKRRRRAAAKPAFQRRLLDDL